MTMQMKEVHSSHVDQIGHDGQDLHVVWDSGKHSVYRGVPAQMADEVMKSWSIGKALTESVKGKFPHEYVS